MVKTYHLSNASESAHAFAKYIFTLKFLCEINSLLSLHFCMNKYICICLHTYTLICAYMYK